MRHSPNAWLYLFAALLIQATAFSGCSVKRYAVNSIGDSLSEGVSVYETDPDMDLVGDALPFSLKLLETLLAESPEHEGMLLSACKGFTLYSYVYVQQEAEMNTGGDLARQRELNLRARRLFLRGLDYGVRGLELGHPGFRSAFARSPMDALKATKRADVPRIYWCAAALGLAISSSRSDAEMIARLPEVDALLARAIELDPDWQEGTLHEFNLILAGARPSMSAADTAGIGKSYERALALSGGKRASLFVSYAETVCVKAQDRTGFRVILGRALAIDPDREETLRLANHVSQRRARWLLGRIDDLFLDSEPATPETTPAPTMVPAP
jgi:predicted anti-sigma-YlaC factor YlaD